MKSIFYTEEHEMFRNTIRKFLTKEISLHIEKWEKDKKVDRSIFKKLGEMGFLSLEIEEQFGGTGLDHHTTIHFRTQSLWASSKQFSNTSTYHCPNGFGNGSLETIYGAYQLSLL